jgi:hypothetical protein
MEGRGWVNDTRRESRGERGGVCNERRRVGVMRSCDDRKRRTDCLKSGEREMRRNWE